MSTAEYEEVVGLSKARLLSDHILVKWEKAPDEFGKTGLLRPEITKGQHFTGEVLAVGPDVSPHLIEEFEAARVNNEPLRIAFDQWSRFEKFWDPEHERVALLAEVKQADCLAIIPPRGEITLKEIQPVGARVLVRVDAKEWEEKAGLIVPGEKKVEVQRGEIIAIGQDRRIEVVPGDVVLYEKYAGAEIEIEGQEYLLLESKKIICMVDVGVAV